MTKILVVSDSMALSSGLAETQRHIFLPLTKLFPNKYNIEQIGFFSQMARQQAPFKLYPTKMGQAPNGSPQLDPGDIYAQKTFDEVVQQVKPDIVFGYGDLWHFQACIDSPFRNQYRLCCYYTVDGEPYQGDSIKDGRSAWGKNLVKIDTLVSLSHFGKKVLTNSVPELKDKDIKVMYHGIDTSRYKELTDEQLLENRLSCMPPIVAKDGFVCGWIGRNQFRKQNYKLWELLHYMVHGDYIQCSTCGRVTTKEWDFSRRETKNINDLTRYEPGYDYSNCWYCRSKDIKAGVPDYNFYIWFHMSKEEKAYNWELEEYIWKVDQNSIYTSGLGAGRSLSSEDMAKLLSCWDMFYYPSGGEGFGNPVFEAMAAGLPVVYTNYSAYAEFTQFGGLPARVANYIPELNTSIRRASVDTASAIEQILKLRHNKQLRKELGTNGRYHAAKYGLNHMAQSWDKIFDEMMSKPLPTNSNQLYLQEV